MSEQTLPERAAEPKSEPIAESEGGKKLSKNALKKLEKEREKAEKKRLAQEKEAAQKAAVDANDVSKGKYGETPPIGTVDYKPFNRKRTRVKDLSSVSDGTNVFIRAKVSNARSQSAKLAFLNLLDAVDSVQAVIAAGEALSRQMVKFAASIPVESLVGVIGTVKNAPEPIKSATISNVELHIEELWIVSKALSQLPISVEDCERAVPNENAPEKTEEGGRPAVTLSTRLDNRVLDLRSTLNKAIFQIRAGVKELFQEYLVKHGFMGIDTPKLLAAPSEGGANVFEGKYFDTKFFLAQSPQFYKQMLVASNYERVYEMGPVFRAENSNTSRHLTEYTSLDMEMEFEEDYEEVLYFLRDLTHYLLRGIETRFEKQTERVRKAYDTQPFLIPKNVEDVPVLTFVEGVALLKESGIEISELEDINSTEEKELGRLVREKYNTDFYILKEYPLAARAFYTMPSIKDPRFSHSYDFMLRGQEVLSGAHRINNTEMLSQRLKELGIDPNGPGLKDYVQMFSNGCPPHAGGAFGAERIVLNWLGLGNVRLATLFPRDPGRLTP